MVMMIGLERWVSEWIYDSCVPNYIYSKTLHNYRATWKNIRIRYLDTYDVQMNIAFAAHHFYTKHVKHRNL